MWRKTNFLLALLAILLLPALTLNAQSRAPGSAVPGTLNYVEGEVAVGGQPVNSQSIGSVQLQQNQVIETSQGRAEILLTPGVFLRLGDNSSLRLLSPNLTNTSVQLLKGQAIVEVTELFKDNRLSVLLDNASTQLQKQGLYAFDANAGRVRVFDGKARVFANDRQIELNKSHEVLLAGKFKARHFDAKTAATQDQLYAWSNLRSEYEAEASMQSARNIFVGGGPYWYGPGWYWNPYWDMYGFIPGDGIWYSPFGWPYYSPYMAYWGGIYGGFGYGGFGYRGLGHNGYLARGHGHADGFGGGHSGGFAGRGFAGGMHAGGFGGFHGGGFAGGGRR
jgi:hypothetical protein